MSRRTRTPVDPAPVEIRVNPTRLATVVLVGCVVAELLFIVLDYHVNYGKATEIGTLRRLVNPAREDSLPSWFSWAQLWLAGLSALLVWIAVRADQGASALKRRGWLVFASLLCYMSLDDGAKFHERVGSIFKAVVGESKAGAALLDAFPSFTWQIIFVPLFGACGLYLLYFLWHELSDRRRFRVVVLALGCFVFAVGLDFVEGLDEAHPLNLATAIVGAVDLESFTRARFGKNAYTAVRHFTRVLEEVTEMLGASLLWWVVLRELGSGLATRLRFRLAVRA